MTKLCVPIYVRSIDQARRDAVVAVERGADMIEFRLDRLANAAFDVEAHDVSEDVAGLIASTGVPCILTCRPVSEGGESLVPDAQRVGWLVETAMSGATYVDIEWAALAGRIGTLPDPLYLARDKRPGLIVSSHDFTGRPANLVSVYTDMSGADVEIAKVVWRARSVRDNIECFELLREALKPTIALCMGEAGVMSRVLARKFNAFLTFASLDDGAETADGQVPVEVMKRRYRWDSIGRGTKVYGVIAHPVGHSLSPHVHNAAFDAAGHDGVYLPLLVQPGYESFKAAMETFLAFEPLDLAGLSVTLPHKENALRYVKEREGIISPLALKVGAANTIHIRRDGDGFRLSASNTDFDAILNTVTGALGCGRGDLRGQEVAILGAGGTGRTAVAAFASIGCDVCVYNRTLERAEALAAEFNGAIGKVRAAPIDRLPDTCCRVYVNTTSLGMTPNTEQSPFDDGIPDIGRDTLVFDTIYTPRQTKLLRQAAAAGARTVNGEPMFLHQAAAQYEMWLEQPAPRDAMAAAFTAALG